MISKQKKYLLTNICCLPKKMKSKCFWKW